MKLTTDNRNHEEHSEYQQDRIDALQRRLKQAELLLQRAVDIKDCKAGELLTHEFILIMKTRVDAFYEDVEAFLKGN